MSEFELDKIIRLLDAANNSGINISLAEDELSVRFQKGTQVDKNILEELRLNKPSLIQYFKSYASNGKKTPSLHLKKVDRSGYDKIPVSYSQERLWFIDKLEGTLGYHLPVVLRLTGLLNFEALSLAMQTIVKRHEVLRTVILEDDGHAHQHIKDYDDWHITVSNFFGNEPATLLPLVYSKINEPFDLANDYMLRAHLIKLTAEEHVLVVTMHHIASDGWSISIIVKEVVELYSALNQGREPVLLPLPVQYADYAIRQREYLQGEVLENKLKFWKEELDGVSPLELPADFQRPAVQTGEGARVKFIIGKDVAAQLQQLARRNDTTLFMTLLAAFKVLLYRYSGQHDVCVGTPIANRSMPELDELIGFFVNTLAIRTQVKSGSAFVDLLHDVRDTMMSAYEHQDAPFEKIADAVLTDRDLSRSPVFQVMFVLQNTPDVPQLKLGELKLAPEKLENTLSRYDVTLTINETANGLEAAWDYSTSLFKKETIDRMIGSFNLLLQSILINEKSSVDDLAILSVGEQKQLLDDFKPRQQLSTTHLFSSDGQQTVVGVFEQQVVANANSLAVVFGNEEISFNELNTRANRLAHYLLKEGLAAGDMVPLCLDRSMEMMVAVWAVLKAGGVYVPIDPSYPQERIKYILEDTAAGYVISSSQYVQTVTACSPALVINADDNKLFAEYPNTNPAIELKHDQLAYVIYTSGSTGKPKGVMIEHGSLMNYLFNSGTSYINLNNNNTGSFIHLSNTFDASLTALFMPLLNGKAVVLGSKHSVDVFDDTNLLKYAPYDFIKLTPSHLELLLPGFKAYNKGLLAEKLVLGGEALHPAQFEGYITEGIDVEVINEYGPTEATVGCTTYSFKTLTDKEEIKESISIGKPIDNASIYILSNTGGLVPIGVKGEICISGAGLAKGYLKRDELTSEKFVINPFHSTQKIYKTGDVGRWLPDGNIEYLGRVDDQVKIRGYRIELGEVEASILASGLVKQSAVLVDDNAANKRLAAYIVLADGATKNTLITRVQEVLPAYMVPSVWVTLDVLPLTSNGKVDKRALPQYGDTLETGDRFVAPTNTTEQQLAEIWKELLNVAQVSIHDNFFELGGDSILTIQVVSRARRFGIELKPKDLFIHQTIAKLAAAINAGSETLITGEQGVLTGASGLLPIQQWFFDKEQPEVSHANQSILAAIDKRITPALLQQAFEPILRHHDALRFKYVKEEGAWQQEYGPYISPVVTESIENDSPAEKIRERSTYYQNSLNIATGEIVNVVLLQTPSLPQNRLFIAVHHLAMDGVSWRILFEDLEQQLNALLKGEKTTFGPKSSSYRQWYKALETYGQSKKALSQLAYWQKAVNSFSPLPTDTFVKEDVRVRELAVHNVRLGKNETSELLHDVPRVYHTEINDILLAALGKTLAAWANTNAVSVGLEGHGREDIDDAVDVSRTIGWFTSLYPLMLHVPEQHTNSYLIRSVKEQLRQVPDKGLGYGVLKYINKEKPLQRDEEPWEIVFNYLGQLDNIVAGDTLFSAAAEPRGNPNSDQNFIREKISINCFIAGGELVIGWTYSGRHFHKSTIEKIAGNYLSNLQQLIAHSLDQFKRSGSVSSPSDFGLGAEISVEELDRFLAQNYLGRPRREVLGSMYRLSSLQEGMLFHVLYDTNVEAYLEQFSCGFTGIDLDVLRQSWMHLINRHSILRTAFYFNEFKVAVQCVYNDVAIPLQVIDYSTLNAHDQSIAISAFDEADKRKGFDYTVAPLMRVTIFMLGGGRYRMLWTTNHILFDGWSFQILMEEFLTNYETLIKGEKIPAKPEDKYEDYIRHLDFTGAGNGEEHWRRYLEGLEQPTLLPFVNNYSYRTKGIGKYEKRDLHIDAAKTQQVQKFAQRHRITVNTIMQAVWSYLLHQYTGQTDVAFGMVVSGRPDDLAGVEKRVGLYINTLIFHSTFNSESSVESWLQTIQEQQVSNMQFHHTPLNVAQSALGMQGDLFDTLLTFENYPVSKVIGAQKWALNVSDVSIKEQTNYPLSILISSAAQIDITFSYNTALLTDEVIDRIAGHFENVLTQLIAGGDVKLNEINLLTNAEKDQLFNNFSIGDQNDVIEEAILYNRHEVSGNHNLSSGNGQPTVVSVFQQQVIANADSLAVVFGDEEISFDELNNRANQLAHYLLNQGLATGDMVPLCIDRSINMMVAIFGILKAGGVYVPVDPSFPQERITYILEDTAARFAVAGSGHTVKLQSNQVVRVVDVDDQTMFAELPATNSAIEIQPGQLAYVIYTSGSTGKPKGVMIEHGSLMNYLFNSGTSYINANTKNSGSFIHLAYTFDASLTALFMPLLNGKAVVISSKHSIDVFDDANLLKYAPYDFIKITPSHLDLLLPAFKAYGKGLLSEKLVLGGEALHPAQFDGYIAEGIDVEIINEYGPTEATVGCSTYSFKTLSDKEQTKDGISIGKPIANTAIYILSPGGGIVPVGVKGELCIGGAGVGRGYLNRNELNAEKFIVNPFKSNEKLYKTGDVARWLPDGNIEYLGRIDDQVKIRGYRIEIGEVEAALQNCEPVAQGTAVAVDNAHGDKTLLGYYVADHASVKQKESALQLQRVAIWKELYETEYGQTEDDEAVDAEFNIVGWNDSFTGGPIPAVDMKKWLDDIVDVVLEDNPGTVLEIGCGTGLIYFQLAGKVEKYIGADLSRSSINQIKKHLAKGLRDYGKTELFTAPAQEVNLEDGQQVDTILLNSMIQYFPGEDYLDKVMERCFELIGNEGRIIVGDVRDIRLLELFKTRLRLQKTQDSVPVKDLKWALDQDVLHEEELCVSPSYFYELKKRYPQVSHIAIQWKQGDYLNELTQYRYTVIIYVGGSLKALHPEWISWSDIADKQSLLAGNDSDLVAIQGVPNPRLIKEKNLAAALADPLRKTAGDIAAAMQKNDARADAVFEILKYAEELGYTTTMLVHHDPFLMNVVFAKLPVKAYVEAPAGASAESSSGAITNIPLLNDISFLFQKDIRSAMHASLPDYMVPSELFVVRQLPLTLNGKVDRSFLSSRELQHTSSVANYVQPSTELEKALAEIWTELLHLDKISINESFFDIGGHSLMAMRLISAIRKQLQFELNIKDLFTHPTIQQLANYVAGLTKGLFLPPVTPIPEKPQQIPLSFSQERLWFIDRLGGSLQYHIPSVLRLTGNLNIDALQHAIQQVVKRHEVLRTVINDEAGTGYQQVQSWEGWNLEVIENEAYNEDAQALQQYIKQNIEQPFNLGKDYMLRATLVKLEDQQHILVATLHHIASDGWSTSIMVKELAELYNSFTQNKEAQLPQLPVQYADYALWQRTYLQGEAWDKKLDYWKQKLSDTAALQIPADYKRPPVQSTRGAISAFRLSKEVSDGLNQLSQKHGATLFMTLLAAFKVLMYRYSGQSDICVGTPIAGRQQSELEGLIGFFVNTLALRTHVNGKDSFEQLLAQVRTTTLEAYDHQEVPFEKVVELTVKDRDMSRSPLFQVMFVLQNTPEVEMVQLPGLQLSAAANTLADHITSKFDLTFTAAETKEGLAVTVEYCTDLYREETISQLSTHFGMLLQSIVSAPQKSIGTLPMLSEAETNYLVAELNKTEQVFSTQNKTIVQLFEEQAQDNPAATALMYNDKSISYGQLNELANQLAHYLMQKGVTTETLVPVCMQRSATLITTLLAIMKAGGAYVPIDPGYPDERIGYMLQDTGASILLTDSTFINRNINISDGKQIKIINVEEQDDELQSQSSLNPAQAANAGQLAYVIYTSGSTGKPKGVMIEHRALVNLIGWHNHAYQVTGNSRATAMAGVGFDAFGWEVWPYLSCGASVVVIDETVRLNPQLLLDEYTKNNITHTFIATALVPGFAEVSRNHATGLKYVLTGGDALGNTEISGLDYTLVNNYGPTENTVVASYYPVTNNIQSAPPIGRPVANTSVYLLSNEGELVPHGAAGELCISGASLARGYLNNPELTSQKFVNNVYSQQNDARLYKTGDLCRWLPDGNLEYLGRKDEQVKIRGYRIELGEIENTIQQSGLVQQSVVLAITDQTGAKQLAGYFVPQQGYSNQQLVAYLTEHLPVYMVPRFWKELESMPLTANGKVDKKALPAADAQASLHTKYVAPGNELEQKLAEIWQELLGVPRVGINDNFFELGGHSLMAMRMVAHIEKTLSVSIPIKALFQFNCISDLSKYLELQGETVQEENTSFQILDV